MKYLASTTAALFLLALAGCGSSADKPAASTTQVRSTTTTPTKEAALPPETVEPTPKQFADCVKQQGGQIGMSSAIREGYIGSGVNVEVTTDPDSTGYSHGETVWYADSKADVGTYMTGVNEPGIVHAISPNGKTVFTRIEYGDPGPFLDRFSPEQKKVFVDCWRSQTPAAVPDGRQVEGAATSCTEQEINAKLKTVSGNAWYLYKPLKISGGQIDCGSAGDVLAAYYATKDAQAGMGAQFPSGAVNWNCVKEEDGSGKASCQSSDGTTLTFTSFPQTE